MLATLLFNDLQDAWEAEMKKREDLLRQKEEDLERKEREFAERMEKQEKELAKKTNEAIDSGSWINAHHQIPILPHCVVKCTIF